MTFKRATATDVWAGRIVALAPQHLLARHGFRRVRGREGGNRSVEEMNRLVTYWTEPGCVFPREISGAA